MTAKKEQNRMSAEEERLPEEPERYFDLSDGTAVLLDLASLRPIRARESGIANARNYMLAAYRGEMARRKPISVEENGDGTYTVMDGNSTYAVAAAEGWQRLPARVWAKGTWSAAEAGS